MLIANLASQYPEIVWQDAGNFGLAIIIELLWCEIGVLLVVQFHATCSIYRLPYLLVFPSLPK